MVIEEFKHMLAQGQYSIRNRTFWYILPTLRLYGPEFVKSFRNFSLLACGILDDGRKDSTYGIYCLLNAKRSKVDTFLSEKDKLITAAGSFYRDDYMYGDLAYDWLHMVVFSFPVDGYKLVSNFLDGKYSKMYTDDVVQSCFTLGHDSTEVGQGRCNAWEVITKNKEKRERMSNYFEINIPEENELDSKPESDQEFFGRVF